MIAAIVQVRMASTRLPEKAMLDISGKPLIWHVVNRLKKSKKLEKIIIATTTNKEDNVISKFSEKEGLSCFRGSVDDVLDRFHQAAKKFNVDKIVRITADCPLIDPGILDEVIKHFENDKYDYVSNVRPPTYPDGLDVEVFSFISLEKAWTEAKLASEREHVTPYIWKHPEIFKIKNIRYKKDLSKLRWCVDNLEDLKFIRMVYKMLYKEGKIFNMNDVLALLEKHPEIAKINEKIKRNIGYTKSVEEDKIVR